MNDYLSLGDYTMVTDIRKAIAGDQTRYTQACELGADGITSILDLDVTGFFQLAEGIYLGKAYVPPGVYLRQLCEDSKSTYNNCVADGKGWAAAIGYATLGAIADVAVTGICKGMNIADVVAKTFEEQRLSKQIERQQ